MRWYRPGMLRLAQLLVGLGMLATYLMWAANGPRPPGPGTCCPPCRWPRAGPVRPADRAATVRPVEDLIMRDAIMLGFEIPWLALFCAGLYVA